MLSKMLNIFVKDKEVLNKVDSAMEDLRQGATIDKKILNDMVKISRYVHFNEFTLSNIKKVNKILGNCGNLKIAFIGPSQWTRLEAETSFNDAPDKTKKDFLWLRGAPAKLWEGILWVMTTLLPKNNNIRTCFIFTDASIELDIFCENEFLTFEVKQTGAIFKVECEELP